MMERKKYFFNIFTNKCFNVNEQPELNKILMNVYLWESEIPITDIFWVGSTRIILLIKGKEEIKRDLV